jgi:HlyD family secretion protein
MLGGMNASANITVEKREGILVLPAEALTEQDGKPAVYTAYDSREETLTNPVPVETGLSDGLQVEIESGLQEGDTVWYSYYDTLEIQGLSN